MILSFCLFLKQSACYRQDMLFPQFLSSWREEFDQETDLGQFQIAGVY